MATCDGTTCNSACGTGFHDCGGSCVSNNAVATCGASCAPCSPPANATATCNGTSCGFTCNSGYHLCGGACVANTSVSSCGATSCTACTPPANATATCDGTSCGFTCNAGYHLCGGACVANTSVSSCGATSCTACTPPANATATCDGTSCGFTCNTGYHDCGGVCVSNNAVATCGTSCTACPTPSNGSATCNGTSCGATCNTGYHACGSTCADNNAVATCGTSCTACTPPANATATCNGTSCGFTCNTGYHLCGGACVANTSVSSCGTTSCTACTPPANSVATCDGTSCGFTCNGGYHACGGACAINTSTATCGTTSCSPCPVPANATATCDGTSCGFTCNAGFHVVGTGCVENRPPLQLAPMSLSDATSRTPAFRVSLPIGADGLLVDVCTDRACSAITQTVTGSGSAVTASSALAARTLFYWRARARVGSVTDTAYVSGIWFFRTPTSTRGTTNTSVRPHLDVNGDGYDDLLVGVPLANNSAGRVQVYLGSASGLATSPSLTLHGSAAGDKFGTSISPAGDINGDSYADVIIGAPGASSGAGAAKVYLGSSTGLSASPVQTLSGAAAGDRFGFNVAGIGDADRDGYADFAVAAPSASTNRGAVSWYRGASSGTSVLGAVIAGPAGSNGQFGLTMAGVGDMNGDTYSDLLVGEPGYNSNQGRLHLFAGSATGLPASASQSMNGGSVGDRFCDGLAGAGDVNADGYSDAVAAAPVALSGAQGGFNVIPGASTGIGTSTNVPSGNTSGAGFGRSMAAAGDVDGDGQDDLVFSTPFISSRAGRVYLATGPALLSTGILNYPTIAFSQSGAAAYAALGASVAGLGDVNGDGYADFAYGAPGENADSLGAVYVRTGGAMSLSTVTAFATSSTGGDRFGAALASADQNVPEDPPACSSGLLRCSGTCVNVQSSATNCGSCGTACATNAGTTANVCSSGTCSPTCATGYLSCDSNAANGCETDITTNTNCGACNVVCSGGQTCMGGSCQTMVTCGSGTHNVGGTCVGDGGPRPVAPISLANTSLRRPTLKWVLPSGATGAVVELCSDRACTSILQTLTATGTSVAPSTDLPARSVVFWRMRARVGSTDDTTNNSPVWLFHTPAVSASTGVDTSYDPHLDVNGDGYDDMVIGQSGYGTNSQGRATVHYGSATGIQVTSPAIAPTAIDGTDDFEQVGSQVSGAGDVNGDGYGDLIVAPYSLTFDMGNSYPGGVRIYHGGPSGVSTTAARLLTQTVAAGYQETWDHVAALGDVNGDGYADIAVGASDATIGANDHAGWVQVHHGSATGVQSTYARRFTGSVQCAYVGVGLGGAGDLNGDGYSDLTLFQSRTSGTCASSSPGATRVYHGSSSGIAATATIEITASVPTTYTARSTGGAGDLNNDGRTELWTSDANSAPGGRAEAGSVNVYPGSATGVNAGTVTVLGGAAAYNTFGRSVSRGDVNGDGYQDLIVGADGLPNPPHARVYGHAYVFPGSATGVSSTASTTLTGSGTEDLFGAVVLGGDYDRDGYCDVVVSATWESVGTDLYNGAVRVFRGGNTGLVTPAATVFFGATYESLGTRIASAGEVLPVPGPRSRLVPRVRVQRSDLGVIGSSWLVFLASAMPASGAAH